MTTKERTADFILLGLYFCLMLSTSGCGKGTVGGQSCLANLKQIDGAKMAWGDDHKKGPEETPTVSDLVGRTNYIWIWPHCPAGGQYTIGKLKDPPACSFPGHALYPKAQ